MNRLATAVASPIGSGSLAYNLTFEQTVNGVHYGYDRYGNMTCVINGSTNGVCPTYSFDQANNQITNTGYAYDAAGHLTSDGQHTYQWDGEGALASIDNGSTRRFDHDAFGLQADWLQPSSRIDFVRNPSGVAVGVATPSGWSDPRVPFGIRRFVSYSNGQTTFFHPNAIGSMVAGTTYNGGVAFRSRFYPWGQTWTYPSIGAVFAGIPERADDIGDSVAFYRDYIPNQGRWLSPDPLGGDITNPQSLNRYAYALNNPTTLTDPLGLETNPCTINGQPGLCTTVTASGGPISIGGFGGGGVGGLPERFHPGPGGGGSGVGTIYITSYGAPVSKPNVITWPQSPTPAQAATNYCQQHGQLSFNIPFTHIPVTISLSATAFVNFSTTNDVSATFPPSAGLSLDITAGAPSGPNVPFQVGVGKNASVGTFLTPHGPSGFSLSIPLSPVAGSPVTLSPNVGNVCGMVNGGGG